MVRTSMWNMMRPLKCYIFSLGYKIDSKIEFLYGKAYVPQNGVYN